MNIKSKHLLQVIFAFLYFVLCGNIFAASKIISPHREVDYYRNSVVSDRSGIIEIISYSYTNKSIERHDFQIIIEDSLIEDIKQSDAEKIKFLQAGLPVGKYKILLRPGSQKALNQSPYELEVWVLPGKTITIIYDPTQSKYQQVSISPTSFSGKLGPFLIDPQKLSQNDIQKNISLNKSSSIDEYILELRSIDERAKEELAIKYRNAEVAQKEKERKRNEEREAKEILKNIKIEEENKSAIEQAQQLLIDQRKKIQEKEREDDVACKSYGAKIGSDAYVNCRVSLNKARKEQEDREKNNKELQERLFQMQRQAERERAEREVEIAEQLRQQNAAQQQKFDEEQRKRDRADRLDAAQRAFDAAARMSQPTPGVPNTALPQINLPQRTTCFRNGNYVDCRTQ